jgi:hypothetical protein
MWTPFLISAPVCEVCLPNLSNEIFVAVISSGWNLFIPFHRGGEYELFLPQTLNL